MQKIRPKRSIHLTKMFSEDDVNVFLKFFDPNCVKAQLKTMKLEVPRGISREAIMLLYFSVSRDVLIDAFWGFSEAYYRSTNHDVVAAIRAGQFVNGFHHWALHGQKEKRTINDFSTSNWRQNETRFIRHKLMFKLFDVEYYKLIMGIPQSEISRATAIEHFLRYGIMNGIVPTQEFDEEFYTAYYEDVYRAKQEGRIPSGYYHYLISGELEERLPRHNSAEAVKKKLGNLSEQIGFRNVGEIEARRRELEISIREKKAKINIFIPAMDGDILFGGYIAFFHFLCRFAERGKQLRFIILEDGQSNKKWFLQCIKDRQRWVSAFQNQEFVNASSKKTKLDIGKNDEFIAYSAWTALDASDVVKKIGNKTILYFIQEYEPIFHSHDSYRFIVESAYNIEHIAVFNTDILCEFFRSNKLGVFSDAARNQEALCFDHALAAVTPASEAFYQDPTRRRRLAFYARPEMHAGRNLFEIGFLALKRACAAGWVPIDWELVGLGSLGDSTSVDICPGYSLVMLPRVDQSQYEAMLQSFDVGISLMWAPHPSIIPFELAKAGCICVTNEFGTRDREFLSRYGRNLEVAEPSIEGIAQSIATAIGRSTDYKSRIDAASFSWSTSWDQSFSPEFFDELERKWGLT